MSRCFELQYIFDSLHEGVYCVDLERKIQFWNKGAERITGYKAEEVLGHGCHDNLLVHIDSVGTNLCTAGCPLMATIDTGEAHCEEMVFLHHKEGHRVPVAVSVSALHDNTGKIIGAIEVFRDNVAMVFGHEYISDLKKAALFDHLTELPNRRYLEMKLHAAFEEMRRHAISFGVLLIDIDHFKLINDEYGHETGDKVLRMVARTMEDNTRAYNVVGRWGGEEFLVIVNHIGKNELARIAEKYRNLIANSFLTCGEKRIAVTVTIGAAPACPDDTAETLLKRVDSLLYGGKNSGRNRVCIGGATEQEFSGATVDR